MNDSPVPTIGRIDLGCFSPSPTFNEADRVVMNRYAEAVENMFNVRTSFLQQMLDPRRDIDAECGYPETMTGSGFGSINPDLYRALYERESIATRVVQIYPNACWQKSPMVFESEDPEVVTPFEEAWDNLSKQLRGEICHYQDEEGSPVWNYCHRVDTLSGVGSFGVMLLGIADGRNLDQPVDGVSSYDPTGNMEMTHEWKWNSLKVTKRVPILNSAGEKVGDREQVIGIKRTFNGKRTSVFPTTPRAVPDPTCNELEVTTYPVYEPDLKTGSPRLARRDKYPGTDGVDNRASPNNNGVMVSPVNHVPQPQPDLIVNGDVPQPSEQLVRDLSWVLTPLSRALAELGDGLGYGQGWYNPDTEQVWVSVGDWDDEPERYEALKEVEGVRSVRVEAEHSPEKKVDKGENWIRVPQQKETREYRTEYSRNSNPNHDEKGRFSSFEHGYRDPTEPGLMKLQVEGRKQHNAALEVHRRLNGVSSERPTSGEQWHDLHRNIVEQMTVSVVKGGALGFSEKKNYTEVQQNDGMPTATIEGHGDVVKVTGLRYGRDSTVTASIHKDDPEDLIKYKIRKTLGLKVPMELKDKYAGTLKGSGDLLKQVDNEFDTNELPSRFRETQTDARMYPSSSMESAQDGARSNFQHKMAGGSPNSDGPQNVNGTGLLSSGQVGTDAQYTGVQLGPSEYPSGRVSKEPKRLLFIRCYDESLVQIVQYEANVRNPRFGMPVMYRITLNDPREQHSGIGLPMATVRVHWSRIIHVSDNNGSSEIFGVPRMRPVLNRLLDLRKIYASSAEGYWQQAFAKLVLSTHPQLGGDVKVNVPQIQNMLENVRNGLQREMLLMGMGASTVAPSVTDPTSHIAVHIEAICIQLGCPIRVFKGSERGELASSQDDDEWLDHVRFRQQNQCTPKILIPLIDRLIAAGVLPPPGSGREPTGKSVPMGKGWKKGGNNGSGNGKGRSDWNSLEGTGRNGLAQGDKVAGGGDSQAGRGSSGSNGKANGFMSSGAGAMTTSSDSPRPYYGERETPVIGNRMTWNRSLDRWELRPASLDHVELVRNAFPLPKPGQPQGGDPSQGDSAGGPPPGGGKGAPPAPKPPKVEVPELGKPAGYSVEWPDLDSLGDKDKAAIALQVTQCIQAYIAGGCEAVLPVFDFFVHVLRWDEELVTPILLKAKAASERDEQGEPVEPPMTTPPHGEPGHPTGSPSPPPTFMKPGQDGGDEEQEDEEPEDVLEDAPPSTNLAKKFEAREKLEAVLNWCNKYGGTTCKDGSGFTPKEKAPPAAKTPAAPKPPSIKPPKTSAGKAIPVPKVAVPKPPPAPKPAKAAPPQKVKPEPKPKPEKGASPLTGQPCGPGQSAARTGCLPKSAVKAGSKQPGKGGESAKGEGNKSEEKTPTPSSSPRDSTAGKLKGFKTPEATSPAKTPEKPPESKQPEASAKPPEAKPESKEPGKGGEKQPGQKDQPKREAKTPEPAKPPEKAKSPEPTKPLDKKETHHDDDELDMGDISNIPKANKGDKHNIQYDSGKILKSAREALETDALKAMGGSLNVKNPDNPTVAKHLQDLSLVPDKLAAKMKDEVDIHVTDGKLDTLSHLSSLKGKIDGLAGAYSWTDKTASVGGVRSQWGASDALHEYGHAVDHALGITGNAEFAKIHSDHFDKLNPYLQQGGKGDKEGQKEMFAEGFASYHKDRMKCKSDFGENFYSFLEKKLKDYQ